jgi:uncharacterized protein YaaN involved in tellurite resistance
MLEGDESTFQ